MRGNPVGWGCEFRNGFAGNMDKAVTGSGEAGCCWCPGDRHGCCRCGGWRYLVDVSIAAVVGVRHAYREPRR